MGSYQLFQRLALVGQNSHSGTYRELIGIAEEVVESARMALEKTSKTRGKDMLADMAIEEIRKDIEHYCGLGSHVIDQARRRVLVPRSRHEALSRRGKRSLRVVGCCSCARQQPDEN